MNKTYLDGLHAARTAVLKVVLSRCGDGRYKENNEFYDVIDKLVDKYFEELERRVFSESIS